MNVIDIIIIVVLLVALVNGYMRGLIVEVLGIASILIAGYCAYYFYIPIHEGLDWDFQMAKELTFVLIFVAIIFGVGLIARILSKVLHFTGLGVLDNVGGAIISVFKYVVILSLLFMLFVSINDKNHLVKQETMDKSSLLKPISRISDYLFPYVNIVKEEYNELKEEFFQ